MSFGRLYSQFGAAVLENLIFNEHEQLSLELADDIEVGCVVA